MSIDRNEMREIAHMAAKETVREMTPEMFRAMMKHHGIDTEDERESQKDFHFLRKMRVGSDRIQSKGVMLVFTAFVTGMIAAGWLGFRHLVTK